MYEDGDFEYNGIRPNYDPFFIPGQTFAEWQMRRRYYPDMIEYIAIMNHVDEFSAHDKPYVIVGFTTDTHMYCSGCKEV